MQRHLKIQHGNGVLVVVGDRESLLHGEGEQLIRSIPNMERCVRHMRNPQVVLNSLESKDKNYVFHRLYRNLFNQNFFLIAYDKIYAKEGNMTAGTDNKTIDGLSLDRIDRIIKSLQDQSYKPNPARRTYIPKKNGKLRPLGIPSIDDKLVQEVLRMILSSIYEKHFSDRSHGFRPNRSCHTALEQVKSTFTGAKWWVEGDIEGFFDNIDHHILINILRRKIQDERFLNLIWKFLKAGYIEEWEVKNTYSGTPQGGIISPILANIYLNELDQYMEEYKSIFDLGKQRKKNHQYKMASQRLYRARRKLRENEGTLSREERKRAIYNIKKLRKEIENYPCTEPFDTGFKRIQYVRYADDFLISVIGSKEEAQKIKSDLTLFLKEKLGLTLSQEKTLITHASNEAKFLGYEVHVGKNDNTSKDVNGISKRRYNNAVRLSMPKEVWINKLFQIGAIKYAKDGKSFKAMHRRYLASNDDLEIISIYNAEVRGLYNFYKLANDVHMLNDFRFWMRWSLLKTFANKYKSTTPKIRKKFNVNGEIGIKYTTKKGQKVCIFHNEPIRKSNTVAREEVDVVPNNMQYSSTTSLIDRLKAEKCEWCNSENTPIEIHHVRKLKALEGKKRWEQFMIARNRKTLALCIACHKKLHRGELD